MRVLLLSSFLIWCQAAYAQNEYMREYLYLGPTPGVTMVPASSNIGILPPAPLPITATPPTNNWYTAGLGLERLLGKPGVRAFIPSIGVGVDLGGILPGQGKVFSNTLGSFRPMLTCIGSTGISGTCSERQGTPCYSTISRLITTILEAA